MPRPTKTMKHLGITDEQYDEAKKKAKREYQRIYHKKWYADNKSKKRQEDNL